MGRSREGGPEQGSKALCFGGDLARPPLRWPVIASDFSGSSCGFARKRPVPRFPFGALAGGHQMGWIGRRAARLAHRHCSCFLIEGNAVEHVRHGHFKRGIHPRHRPGGNKSHSPSAEPAAVKVRGRTAKIQKSKDFPNFSLPSLRLRAVFEQTIRARRGTAPFCILFGRETS
jgi:hypothetical protein